MSGCQPAAIAAATEGLLASVLQDCRQCALLDFPDYGNVGDSAIWLGQLEALRRIGVEVRYVASALSLSPQVLRERMPRGVILIGGGGNFGTLWPQPQAHRERVLAEFRDYPVVQLPQSIFYDSDESLQRTRELIAAHPDFTLMVRDEASLRIATERLRAKAAACCDSAFFLHGKLARSAPEVDIFVLARSDKERSAGDMRELLAASGCSFAIDDWVEDPMTLPRWLAARWWPRAHGRLTRVPGFFGGLGALWRAAAWRRARRGSRALSRGRVVITDRLHAHILCVLLDIPHVVLDNSYGKVQGFIASWTAGSPLVHRASTPAEAVARAKALLAPPTSVPAGVLAPE